MVKDRLLTRIFSNTGFLVFLLFALAFSSIFTSSVSAQENNIFLDTKEAWSKGTNMETWLGKEAIKSNVMGTLNALIEFETAPDEFLEGQVYDQNGQPIVWIPGGVVGSVNNLIAATFSPPASGVEYIAQMKNSFLGKPAYAQQGVGFVGLQPLLDIWRTFRNIVYIFSSLILIAIGFMIILRIKISPQATITIQNALPRLFMTLILVTFSYAIAGLVIDLLNLIQAIAIAAIFQARGITNLNENLFSGALQNIGIASSNYRSLNNFDLVSSFYLMIRNSGVEYLALIGAVIGGVVGAIAGTALPVVGNILLGLKGAAIGAGIVTLIFSIIIVFFLFKFFFGLIKCYVAAIVKIILAPLEIGLGAFPNSKMGFSSWIIDLVANLSVFPISLIFLIILNVIVESIKYSGATIWTPQILSAGAGLVPFFIGMGGLLMVSKLPELIPQAIFQLKPSPWGSAVGEGLGNMPIIAPITKNIRGGLERYAQEEVGKQAEERISQATNWFAKRRTQQTTAEDQASRNSTTREPPSQSTSGS